MDNAPKIRRLVQGPYTITIAYLETRDDCTIGLSFCSALDNPNHFRGRQIAIGRLYKDPLSIRPYMSEECGHIDYAVNDMLEDYFATYCRANKRERIILEKRSRFPRWLEEYFKELDYNG